MAINPKMSKRETERLLKRMGIAMDEVEGVQEVRIVTNDRTILIRPAQVVKLTGSDTPVFQVIGQVTEEIEKEAVIQATDFTQEDVLFVAQQTNKTPDQARKVLAECGGDIAKAILSLKM